MTNSISQLGSGTFDGAKFEHGVRSYCSVVWCDSDVMPGVRFAVARMSFGRRIELARRMREIGRKIEFFEAGSDARDKLEAAALGAEIDREYLAWGLVAVDGLQIDGMDALPETVIEKGPAELSSEMLDRIKRECALSEAERKN
ncbi:MAG: hypothetical protein ABL995_12125 [Bryobacteraceae bacterium]